MEMLDIAKSAASLAVDKKAKRVVLLDLCDISDLCDYTLICSGDNHRQTRAIAEEIQRVFKQKFRMIPSAVEGMESGYWVLLDYGSIIIHIFYDYLRNYYALEQLWPSASFVDIKQETAKIEPQKQQQ